MVWPIFFRRDNRRKRQRSVRAFLAAVNAARWDEAAAFLAGDVVLSDVGGSDIVGQDALLEREQEYHRAYASPQVHVSQISDNDGEVLLRGHVDSRYEDIAGPVFMRVMFRDGLIRRIEVTREGGLMTLPKFRPEPQISPFVPPRPA